MTAIATLSIVGFFISSLCIKKVLSEPTIAVKSMEIARQYRNDPDADERIAREISSNTTIRIPENWSEADRMFLEIIREVLDDEEALY